MSIEREAQLGPCGTLEGFGEVASRTSGVELERLEPLTQLVVQTENTRYEIFVIDPLRRRVLVRGGRFFAEPVEACLDGSSFGGSFVKLGAIRVGMRMEFHAAGRPIVTSRVRSICKIDDAATHRPS